MAELRALPAESLLDLANEHFKRGYDDPPVDGWLLPAPPADLLARKAFEPRPVTEIRPERFDSRLCSALAAL